MVDVFKSFNFPLLYLFQEFPFQHVFKVNIFDKVRKKYDKCKSLPFYFSDMVNMKIWEVCCKIKKREPQRVLFCWDTRTRTRNDRTRICSVTITPYPKICCILFLECSCKGIECNANMQIFKWLFYEKLNFIQFISLFNIYIREKV